jgi:hypothetical protein
MGSELKKYSSLLTDLIQSTSVLHEKASDPGNIHISIASIISVYEDRTTCDVLLDNAIPVYEIRSIIPTTVLNTCSHLVAGDDVLVIYSYPGYTNASIIMKLNKTNKAYTDDKAFEVTNRLNLGLYAI